MMSLIVDGDWSSGSGADWRHAAATMSAAQRIDLRYLFTRVVYGRYENPLDVCVRRCRDDRDSHGAGTTSDSNARADSARRSGSAWTRTGPRTWGTRWRSAAGARSAAGRVGHCDGHAGDHRAGKVL